MRERASHRLVFGQFYGNLDRDVRVGDLLIREVSGRPHGGIPRHTHESAHFCLVVRGDYHTTTRDVAGRCTASTLLFHPAGTTHDDQFRGGVGSCITVSLPETVLGNLGDLRLAPRSTAYADEEIGFPGARITRELRRPDRFSALALEGLVLELLARADAHRRRESSAPAWLERARAFVRDHAADPARVADIAEAVEVHPVHLARVFRERIGVSPGEYLRRVRVRRAMESIARTDDSLATVAVRTGFCDQSELTKAFRRELGMTPSAYRRMLRD